jgi:hypothetical protein
MEPYVWRVPTLLGAMAVSSLVLFVACVVRACVTRRHPSIGVRAGTGALLGLLAVGGAVGLRAIAAQLAQSLEIDIAYVGPGALGYLAPLLFAAGVFALGGSLLRGRWGSRRALFFYAWLLAFTLANVINRCSPGWCETIGLPFAWRSWSDSVVTIGDGRVSLWLSGIASVVAAAMNLVIFAAVAGALTRAGASNRSA